jgi:DNA helicase-2/ATP-dependent DNA helicase PcrA
MESKNFNELYRKLNSKQKEAVDTIEGPVMVVAGPGTGKTQILSLRIANILKKTDASPDSILALTFTDSGVHSMRKRLVSIMGSTAYRVNIFTFHGFCNNLIKSHPEYFDRIISSKNVSQLDQVKIMESVILRAKIKLLRPFGDKFYYAESALKAISDLKREGVSIGEFEKRIKEERIQFEKTPDLYHKSGPHSGKMRGPHAEILKNINKNRELLLLYKGYEKTLRKEKLYDYDDMIMEVVSEFRKNGELLLKMQESFQYILVDEHQDTNNAQNSVLELLAGFYESPNLFIVGDEKQAIFRFQGASLNNFLYFKDLYKDAKVIQLEDNYRSTQTILDSAHSLIIKGSGAEVFRKKLVAKSANKSKKISLHVFPSEDAEIFGIVDDLHSKLNDQKVSPGNIAIIYRDNHDAFSLARALERTQIPFAIESEQNILDDENIKKLVDLLYAIEDFGSEDKFIRCLHLDFLKIDEFLIYKFIDYSKKQKIGILDFLNKNKNKEEVAGVGNIVSLSEVFKKMLSWSKLARNTGVLDFFEMIVRDSGYLNYILCAKDSVSSIEKLSVVFDNLKKIVESHRDMKLSGFVDFLKAAKDRRILRASQGEKTSSNVVHLMTAHRSKGLEFDYVYILGIYDTHWGNRRTKKLFKLPIGHTEDGGNDDERRLFYVAITRAKKEVYLSYSKKDSDGKLLLPSQFIEEIDPDFIETVDEKEVITDGNKIFIKNFEPRINSGVSSDNKNFLNEIFLMQGFSVTALNNYLKCPWSYFYRNLIRIPESPDKFLMFGNVIHYTLNDFFNKFKEGNNLGEKRMLVLFEKYLKHEPFEEDDLRESLKRGKAALKGYHKRYAKEWSTEILNEFKLHVTLPELPVTLTGKIDKIEIMSGNEVNVVDYKTGKIKSRGEVEGTTKGSDGDMKRQLIFYRLLLDNYDGGKMIASTGEIDFILPDDKGRYKKERIEIKEADVLALAELIKKVSGEILDLSFWNKRCDKVGCKYCALRNSLSGRCDLG